MRGLSPRTLELIMLARLLLALPNRWPNRTSSSHSSGRASRTWAVIKQNWLPTYECGRLFLDFVDCHAEQFHG